MPSDGQQPLRRRSPIREIYDAATRAAQDFAQAGYGDLRRAELDRMERMHDVMHIHETLMGIEDELQALNCTLAQLFGNGGPVTRALWASRGEKGE